jgi:hypothetical protein
LFALKGLGLLGQLFGDRGYISQPLFEELYERGLQLVTKSKKNMKQRLVKLMDKILLRKRSVIESVNDQLKNICQTLAFSSPQLLEFFG